MDSIAEIILKVIPWFEELFDTADIVLRATPAFGQVTIATIFIMLGGYLFLSYEGHLPGPFNRRREDDD